jgi:hypothetical protein
MCGRLLPVEGEEASPLVVPPPFGGLGADITANATCCAHFCNPPHQRHIARPLPGQGFEARAFSPLRSWVFSQEPALLSCTCSSWQQCQVMPSAMCLLHH